MIVFNCGFVEITGLVEEKVGKPPLNKIFGHSMYKSKVEKYLDSLLANTRKQVGETFVALLDEWINPELRKINQSLEITLSSATLSPEADFVDVRVQIVGSTNEIEHMFNEIVEVDGISLNTRNDYIEIESFHNINEFIDLALSHQFEE